jgi:hypothetical protein
VNRRTWAFVAAGLVVAVVLAFGVSRFASSQPDGLEKVAADKALDTGEEAHTFGDGPLADYSAKGIDDPGLSTGVAGLIGVAVVFVVGAGLVWGARAIGRRPPVESTAGAGTV